jgi:hypothetical protein
MTLSKGSTKPQAMQELNFYCSPDGTGAFRVYTRPGLPRYLSAFVDLNGEIHPVELDFEQLERHMAQQGAAYDKSVDKLGGIELTARGASAQALGEWLATMLASGVRPSVGATRIPNRQSG